MSKACYVVVNQSTVPAVDLPTGYTQLDYVEGTGDQYVDTGFKPNQNTRLQMDVDVLSMGSSDRFLFGARAAYQDTAIYLASTSGNSSWLVGYADDVQTISDQCTGRHTIDYNQNTITIDDISHSFTVTTFAPDYNMYLFACNQSGTAIANKYAIMRLYSCKIYDNGTLASNYIPCKNASGTAGLYDLVNSSFVSSATSIDLVAGTAQGNAVKKVKKKYVVVEGVTRKVKKKYVVVDGVAKRVYGYDDVITYDGTATPLSVARGELAATTVGDYALFGGGAVGHESTGSSSDTPRGTVDAYNKMLTRSSAAKLTVERYGLAAASVGRYALFAGGEGNSANTWYCSQAADAYDQSLTRSTAPNLFPSSSQGSYNLCGVSHGAYALFCGGDGSTSIWYYDTGAVGAYNQSLTYSSPTALSKSRFYPAGTHVGNYAIIGGGRYYTNPGSTDIKSEYDNTVDAYNQYLTRSTPTPLRYTGRYYATTVGDYALFGGDSAAVDAYNSSLTRSTPTELSTYGVVGATTVGNCAIFGGYNETNAYNSSLTRSLYAPISSEVGGVAAVSIGDYALFGGGATSRDVARNTVDVYKYS